MAYELVRYFVEKMDHWLDLSRYHVLPMYYVLDLEVQNGIFLSRSHSQSCLDIAVKKVFCNTTTSISGRECSCIQLLHYNSVLLNNIFISGRRRLLWWCFRREGERKKLSHFPRLPCVLLLNMAVSPILVPNNNNNPISWDIIVTSRESTPALP